VLAPSNGCFFMTLRFSSTFTATFSVFSFLTLNTCFRSVFARGVKFNDPAGPRKTERRDFAANEELLTDRHFKHLPFVLAEQILHRLLRL
jgi:hypothetical protein